ncbi:MAG: TetR/AcrR family transcriptional regulator [Phenylobacterium sp.]|nr:TetR/AcrR family transcriptional regulator [Phenylobacterium sp.]
MPRRLGQVDESKGIAILEAARQALAERGMGASIEDIARRARVSKQTVYNRFGSKAELVRVLIERRVDEITAHLDNPGSGEGPEEALAGYARVVLESIARPSSIALLRIHIQGAAEMPDLARTFFDTGARTSRARLAAFLDGETRAGRLRVEDSALAAEFFAGMVIGSHQTGRLLGVESNLDAAVIDRIAREAASRFVRAYGP